ncbi:uncharacterized protein [Choristoneura fumiferana]|uniref:uncharacterized protein n=1 Tax=Choristoneura fumiferana TaxID=7141 RepID=UPI003D153E6A
MEPSEEESRNLLQTRGYVKASLSKLHKLAQPEAALQQYSVEYLKAKRERAQALFMEYDDYCRKITFSGYKDAEDETTENKYFDVVAALDEEINKRAAAAAAAASAAVAQDKSTEHVSTGSVKKVTLPPIAIQTFSDNFTARAYQLERDPATEPSIEHLLRFLEKRALALENVEQGHGPPASEARAPG